MIIFISNVGNEHSTLGVSHDTDIYFLDISQIPKIRTLISPVRMAGLIFGSLTIRYVPCAEPFRSQTHTYDPNLWSRIQVSERGHITGTWRSIDSNH